MIGKLQNYKSCRAAPTAYRLLKANDQLLPEGENLGLRVASCAGEALIRRWLTGSVVVILVR